MSELHTLRGYIVVEMVLPPSTLVDNAYGLHIIVYNMPKIKNHRITHLVSALLLISLLLLNGLSAIKVHALPAGAGLQASSLTAESLQDVTNATTLVQLTAGMQKFISQYGSIQFSTSCPSGYTCVNLADSDVGGVTGSTAKHLSIEFIEEWSKYPVAWVQASLPTTLYFTKQISIGGYFRAAVPANDIDSMMYSIDYAINETYMRSVIHHEYDHFLEDKQTGYQGNQPDATWSSYNPSGFSYGSGGASCYSGPCPVGEHVIPGFATGYATSGIEEDKAELYAHLFWTEGYGSMQTWVQTDTNLAQKVTYYKNRIKVIVPSMDDSYFASIHAYYAATHGSTQSPEPSTNTITIATGDNQPALAVIVDAAKTYTIDGTRGDVTVNNGGILKGTGTVGALDVALGATVAPGHSPGCLASNNLTISGSYEFEIGGVDPCSGYDQIKVTGTVSLNNSTLNTKLSNSYIPKVSESYILISNNDSDAVTGTFAGLSEGAVFTKDGVTYAISYKGGDGNDVVLSVKAVNITAPNTGFSVLYANPLVALSFTIGSALILFMLARKKLTN